MDAHSFLAVLLAAAFGLAIAMALAWLLWRRTRNSGWVDVAWTVGVGIVAALIVVAIELAGGATLARSLIVVVLAMIWTLRLGSHIALRTRSISDDPRYARLIREWGAGAEVQMFWLLQKQAWVSIPLVLAIILAAANPVHLRLADGLGAALLLIAVGGEAMADRQLRRHRAQVKGGEVMSSGLWGWSRHPNYFFQWLGWLAYPLIAIDAGGLYPWGWLSVLAPVAMYWLLNYISGIPPLEEHMLATRGARYEAYRQRTNAFFPFPPRLEARQ